MTLGRQRGPRGRSRDRTRDVGDREQDAITETVVNIRRVAKTVAGGRRFTFNALVVVGDGQGRVGFGLGKASEVPDAVQKGSSVARRSMLTVPLVEHTVPQQIVSRFGGAQVLLKPAAPGTGVRASAAVRAVVQAAGVHDILTKSLGSSNPINVVQATLRGMQMMRSPAEVLSLRRMVRGEPPLETQVNDAEDSVEAAETDEQVSSGVTPREVPPAPVTEPEARATESTEMPGQPSAVTTTVPATADVEATETPTAVSEPTETTTKEQPVELTSQEPTDESSTGTDGAPPTDAPADETRGSTE